MRRNAHTGPSIEAGYSIYIACFFFKQKVNSGTESPSPFFKNRAPPGSNRLRLKNFPYPENRPVCIVLFI